MMRFVLLVAVFVCVQGSALPPVPMLDGRIVGGSPATINEAPYQVALLKDSLNVGIFYQTCGGSIITRNTIVTAAHCTDKSRSDQWRVRAGSALHNSGGQLVGVRHFRQHELYNSRFDNDIALMFLSTDLVLGPTVAVVPLPAQGATVADRANAFVTGWGVHTEGGISPDNLYKVTVPTVNQAQCINAYSAFNPVTNNMICAGLTGIGGVDACQGDSGGPMTVNGILIGITSWGRGCALPQYPGVYARVPALRTWINNNL